jgi:hypothetical protein
MFFSPAVAAVAVTEVLLAGVAVAFDLATGVQTLAVLVGLATVMAVGSSKRKDATIKDFKDALEGASARADTEHELRRTAERQVSELAGKVDALERYAAPDAFKSIAHTLGGLEATMKTSIDTQGELILKNTELVAGSVAALERVAADLEALTERIHPEQLKQLLTDFGKLAQALGAIGERPPGGA